MGADRGRSGRGFSTGGLFLVMAAGCLPPPGPTEVVSRGGQKKPLRPADVRVIAAAEAASSNLVGRPLSLTFGGGRDGTELVEQVFAEGERRGAVAVGSISVTLAADRDGRPIACRTAILPETVSESRWTPPSHRLVSVSKPVSRMVTERQYRCHLVSHPETRHVMEYQQRCRTVSRPVTRTRTTYSYQYSSRGSRSVPRTESYTSYESHQDCHSEPVSRTRTEYVSKNECRYESQTHFVTRYEHQLETQYVPPRLETFQRHRLRETEPVCYEVDDRPTASAGEGPEDGPDGPAEPDAPPTSAAQTVPNRIDATLYFQRPGRDVAAP